MNARMDMLPAAAATLLAVGLAIVALHAFATVFFMEMAVCSLFVATAMAVHATANRRRRRIDDSTIEVRPSGRMVVVPHA